VTGQYLGLALALTLNHANRVVRAAGTLLVAIGLIESLHSEALRLSCANAHQIAKKEAVFASISSKFPDML
jgi:hypothetical protein